MKRAFKISAVAALFAVLLFAGCKLSDAQIFKKATGIKDLPEYETVTSTDTHGGFLGDGELHMQFTFTAENGGKLKEILRQKENWHKTPVNEIVCRLTDHFSTNSLNNVSAFIERTFNGYYFFYDKQTKSYEIDEEILDRWSYNFRLAVFDCDRNVLIYYEVDT